MIMRRCLSKSTWWSCSWISRQVLSFLLGFYAASLSIIGYAFKISKSKMKRIREDDLPPEKMNKIGEQDHQLSSKQRIYDHDGGDWKRGPMLGKGGFGTVHMALLNKKCGPQFRSCPRVMAVKSAYGSKSMELLTEKFLLERFRDNPFIIRCFGDDVTVASDGQPVLNVFLEFAGGGTLFDLIKRAKKEGGLGVLDESIVRQHTRSILQGLKRIHEDDLVHCDLKLENILLVREENDHDYGGSPKFVAKIADLGMTKMVGRKRCVGGTRSYWSPEIVRDKIQGQPSDIWALGCIVFRMLTGKLPWQRQYCVGHNCQEMPVIPSGLSTEAKDFLNKCFMRNPSDRPTAEMLLSHPFVCGLIEKEEDDRQCVYFSADEGHSEDSSVVSVIPISSG